MLHIVGGTYLERCQEPAWYELFGSGGRAVTALTELEKHLTFSTYIGKEEEGNLDNLAAIYKFKLNKKIIPQTLSFDYLHCLTEPKINPPIQLIKEQSKLVITGTNILRFGMLEGDALVHGKKVVYDPQSAYNPSLFTENGSTAEHLAIVTNASECRKLMDSKNEKIEDLGKLLLKKENAEVVVIKRGSLGSIVITPDNVQNIPAYKTRRIWSLGSGDVFAAIFTHFWINNKSAVEAAEMASKATAYYCNSKALTIPEDFEDKLNFRPIENNNNFPQEPKKLYLAGPFFTMAERWIINQARNYLIDEGFKVFSPLHDVGYGTAEEVAPKDIEGLRDSDVVFAILDGLDAGTIFEIGYARSLDIPVIVLVQNESEEDLKMIVGTNCHIISDFVTAIYHTAWTAMGNK